MNDMGRMQQDPCPTQQREDEVGLRYIGGVRRQGVVRLRACSVN